MPWIVMETRIGKAGGLKNRTARQLEWDRKYGENRWDVGYVIDGEFVSQNTALETVYQRSYDEHFRAHPKDLAELIHLAARLRNPHAEATTGVDLQVPAILACIKQRGMTLIGQDTVDIGSWRGQASHPISIRLSPLTIRCALDPQMTLEQFWQERKCLAVWVDS